ncbi:alpha/beta hydrolase-fold protein [Pseudoxanthomonas broegbernensis]|nr:alpha/beta hydrolase-fold protein [Pseudoxanthomonas broegbernensis]MBB6066247.1 putative alpha/beta superfamily hydrolase [Pseudoxanthomonas broegbernensis]
MKRALSLAILLAALSSAVAPAAPPPPPDTPVQLPGTHAFGLHSRAGLEYRIFVSEPAAPAPPSGWPVVYVLDGNAWFAHAAQQVRVRGGKRPDKTGVLPALVVGVGYPGDAYINSPRRTPDFTPDVPLRTPNPAGWAATGGADTFMAFLVDELKPLINSRYATDQDKEILFGHSLGGLFALHAWFNHPAAFDGVVSASPSTWWNEEVALDWARRFAGSADAAGRKQPLLVATGAAELESMVAGARGLERILAGATAAGAPVQVALLEDEDHLSAAPVAINRLVRRFLAPSRDDIDHALALLADDGKADALVGRERSLVGAADGRGYRVREYRPAGVAAEQVRRTIYVLEDGEVLQAALRQARGSAVPTAVVGLRQGDGRPLQPRAFTPTPDGDPENRAGAEDLLKLLHAQVVPEIAGSRGPGGEDRVLVGSARAGLFALYAVANAPETFAAVVAVAPELDWRGGFVLSPNVIGRIGPKLAVQGRAARVVLLQEDIADPLSARLRQSLEAIEGVQAPGLALGEAPVQAVAAALDTAFGLADTARPARMPVFAEDTGLPVPDADAYVALTPQQRFDLRMRLRALPKPRQDAWVRRFKFNLDAALWFYEHRLLHEEKTRMDAINAYEAPAP